MNRQLPGAAARAGTALSFGLLGFALLHVTTSAQDRLKTMPGYAQYQKVSAQINGAVRSGALGGTWSADSGSVEYVLDGKRYRFDVAARAATEIGAAVDAAAGGGRSGRGGGRGGTGIERGRQAASADSPDGKLKAFYRDRNLWVSEVAGANETAITTDGSDKDRIKYGTASWVYGEELGQTTRDLVVARQPQGRVLPLRREAGARLLPAARSDQDSEHERRSRRIRRPARRIRSSTCSCTTSPRRRRTKIDVRDGKPFDNDVVGHYVYRVSWSPDGRELLFNRTNRRQNILEFVAASPDTGASAGHRPRGVADRLGREPAADAVPEGQPALHLGVGAQRLDNFYLYDLSGKLITPLTTHTTFEVGGRRQGRRGCGRALLHRPRRRQPHEAAAAPRRARRQGRRPPHRSGVPPHRRLVHAGSAGGRGGRRPSACGISPDNKYFVDVYQTHDTPPATRVSMRGRQGRRRSSPRAT